MYAAVACLGLVVSCKSVIQLLFRAAAACLPLVSVLIIRLIAIPFLVFFSTIIIIN